MATAVFLNDIIKCVVWTKFTLQPQYGLNTHFFQVGAVAGAPTLENQINSISLQLKAGYVPLMVASATFSGITLQRYMLPTPLGVPVPSTTAPQVGAIAGDALPPNITGIITFNTGLAGRAYRGRSYIPFPGEADNGPDGFPIANYSGIRLNGLGSLLSTPIFGTDGAGNTTTLNKVIYHGRQPGRPYTLVTSYVPRYKWAQQHRRGDYGRPNDGGPF